ncbi:MAG: RDD family protein, partial [Acidimicrobiia bacterium]
MLIRRLFASDPDGAEEADVPRRPDLAPPRARLVAAAIDVSLMAAVLIWVGAVGADPAFGNGGPPLRVRLLAWAAVGAHLIVLEGLGGQTLGKRLVGIRVVSAVSGQPIGLRAAAHRAGARAAFWFVSFLAL